MRASEVARFMRAFGDGTRLRIILLLARSPCSVAALAQSLRCPLKRISRHLQYLAARGVVGSHGERGHPVYHLCSPGDPLHRGALAALAAVRDRVVETGPDQSRAARLTAGGV